MALIVFVSIYCIFTYSANLQKFLVSSFSSNDLFQRIPISEVQNHSWYSTKMDVEELLLNVTIEKPWSSIYESSVGIHLFTDKITSIRLVGERHVSKPIFHSIY